MSFKSDTYNTLIKFIKIIKTQFKISIKVFRLDNTKEFKFTKLASFCNTKGIIYKYTSLYSTLAPNSIAKQLNQYIIERLICISIRRNILLKLYSLISYKL